ncbi:MAG: FMN-binding glutamate synthase family protein [Clostridia bacterium]|jgi:glutamate synthase domain-containing protein 2
MKYRRLKKAAMIGAGAAAAGTVAAKWAARRLVDKVHDDALTILMQDLYEENLWEMVSSTARIGLQTAMETNLRSTMGRTIARPMGPPKKFPSLDELVFNIAQLYTMPTPLEQKIDTRVIIGKKSEKPFTIDMPVMIAPMAYGTALTRKAKVALAKGSAMAGIATNTGEGPFLTAERQAADILIYQYNRGDWGKTPGIMRQCDAIEIQLGQGAIGGVGHILKADLLDKELRNAFHYPKGKDVVAHSKQPEVQQPEDLRDLVIELKTLGEGVPIGVKMAAGKYLEADLDWVCRSGVDFIALEGAEAATKGSAPILQDDFGVPLVFAITRTANWLKQHGFKDRVSLIACGKIVTPGDMLKVCALGADACYIGTIALFAMSHTQVTKALPFEPPTQLIWYDGKEGKQFDIDKGADALYRFLMACKEEMDEGIKALGKTALCQVDREDLSALNETIARGCKIPMVYEPFVFEEKEGPKKAPKQKNRQ